MRPVAFAVVFAGALAAGALLAARQDPAQAPPFRAATHTVSIYATVFDNNGRLVSNLSKNDFEVYDDGKLQPMTVFSNDLQPITVVILLDRSGSMAGNFETERAGAEKFVANLLPADKVRLGSFSYRIQIDPATFTSDKSELIRILHENLLDAGSTPLWNATNVAMNALSQMDGRRVVLLFSDGYDSPEHPGQNVTFADVHGRARREEIMVYAIGLGESCSPSRLTSAAALPGELRFQGRGGPPVGTGGPDRTVPRGGGIPTTNPLLPPGRGGPLGPGVSLPIDKLLPRKTDRSCSDDKPDPSLRELASDGGGAYYELKFTDDLATTFARVADELHRQYLLGFVPAQLDGRTHDLEVRIKKPNLTIRARRTYIAGK